MVRFLELAIDQSLAAIQELDEQVDDIQNAVIENATHKNLRAIFRIKRSAIQLHKMLSPQREVLNRLARDPYKPIQPKHRVYFRDLYDHVVRIHDISESLRDLISGTLETYLSVVANRTNDIMKILTIVTVMFMPMSFIVGFFGMNFFADSLAFTAPLPKWLAVLGLKRDHGGIALFYLVVRASDEMVLTLEPAYKKGVAAKTPSPLRGEDARRAGEGAGGLAKDQQPLLVAIPQFPGQSLV